MGATTMEAQPIAGALGAELTGVDLARDLDDETFAAIHQALLDHCVIFFRDQDITPDQQLAFAKRFGGIHLHPYLEGLPGHPEILEIKKTETDTRNFGGVWHTDQMFSPTPAMATMLYAKETPAAGGDTMFASMYLAYEALSVGMKEALARLKTLCLGDRTRGQKGASRAERYKEISSIKLKDPGAIQTESEHPLIRTHPETGRTSLYIGSHVEKIVGMTDEESAPLLDFLRAHATRPEFTCRFRWAVGSMAIWDNRCVMHNALNDYAGQRRRMHRITIQGDRPF